MEVLPRPPVVCGRQRADTEIAGVYMGVPPPPPVVVAVVSRGSADRSIQSIDFSIVFQ